jgi:hypothetical protein
MNVRRFITETPQLRLGSATVPQRPAAGASSRFGYAEVWPAGRHSELPNLYAMQTGQQMGGNLSAKIIATLKDSRYRARAIHGENSSL